MRYLLTLLILASVGWTVYWFIGANRVKSELSTWFEMRQAENWQAEYQDLTVRGFPYRFEADITNPAIADPASGLAWQAPFFQMQMLSYKPNHIIAIWPSEQQLATPFANFDLKSDDMRASLVVTPKLGSRLDRTNLTAAALNITERATKQSTKIDTLSLAAMLVTDNADANEPLSVLPTYHLGLAAADVTLNKGWLKILDPENRLPAMLAGFKADMTVAFDRYWDQSSLDTARPQPRHITIKLAEARWGALLLQATGTLEVDNLGIPTGEITVKAENWRDILELARRSGQIDATTAGLLENGLQYIAAISGNSKNLDIPLTFKNGQIRLGPIPIAPAPILRLR